MRIFMHWDMEGVSGLFTREHVWFWEEGVRGHIAEEGRRLLMADMGSAAAAALGAGADHVIVCDTHHGGRNIRVAWRWDCRMNWSWPATMTSMCPPIMWKRGRIPCW